MQDNIIATIIFIIAVIGMIILVVYRMKKDNENKKINIEDFLNLYHNNLFNILQDVVSLISINIDDFESKEEYERIIISTTIEKLEENCDEFGINSTIFNLVDRKLLTDILYDILYTNKVQIFFSSLPEKIIERKPELYDKEVIEAFENAEPALNEDEYARVESQEEYKHEEKEVIEQKEAIDTTNNEKNKEIEEYSELETNNEISECLDNMPNADVNSAVTSINSVLNGTHVDRD